MPKFRKKPVEIEAIQWDGGNAKEIFAWILEIVPQGDTVGYVPDHNELLIPTLEGEMRASVSDWIICGVNKEFYPCKDDIFRKTYDPVDTEAANALGLESDMKRWGD